MLAPALIYEAQQPACRMPAPDPCGHWLASDNEPMERRDYTAEAEALFQRFADRHGLTYETGTGTPIEVCWTFPEQPKLSMPLTLGLQNCDELNFGVSDFWSYFFPFDAVANKFERILDAWVVGDARVAITGFRSRLLQVREGARWKTVYGANGCLFPFRWTPIGFVMNESEERPPSAA